MSESDGSSGGSSGPDFSLNRWRKLHRFMLNRSTSAPEGSKTQLHEFLREYGCEEFTKVTYFLT